MTQKIPKTFITEVLLKTNIIDLIKSKLDLKKKGKNYQSKCPFHEEKTPSFIVNHEKQIYHCFGCNAHGNAIDFLMNYDGLTFMECIEELSMLNNISIPYTKNNDKFYQKYEQKKKLYNLMSDISNIYWKNLKNKKSKKKIDYIKKRGIKKKIFNLFLLGYSNSLTTKKILNISKNYTIQDFIQTGVININYSGKKYDRFYKRIIFPIRNQHGKINGFGGRLIKENEKFPKYINSPETKIFHKKKQIYGIYELKKKNNLKYLIVVEGYFDVILLKQWKINNVISILGTSCTVEHLKKMFNMTKTIIFCYDGDQAGRQASWQTLIKSLPYLDGKKSLKFIFLPKNEDPDSIIKKEGKKSFKKRIKNAIYMSEYFFQKILKKYDIKTVEGKKNFFYDAISLIKKIPNLTYQFFLYKSLREKIGIFNHHNLKKIIEKKNTYKKKKYSLMRILVSLIIQNPQLHQLNINFSKISKIKNKGIKIFSKIIKICKKKKILNTGILLEEYRNNKKYYIIKYLSNWKNLISQNKIKKTFLEIINFLYIQKLKKKIKKLLSKEKNKKLTKKDKIKIWILKKKILQKEKTLKKNF
ncbi:DNA primase [Buchnera aphidicola]|uniref:DNA primase n=1 Tax=Buchnera aphidicola TaxID=9 RepID=UPI0025436933|nr:DNA primase [Buchnera aphidicola]WII23722.1 DNA primase [Buchnera aphidicola (Sipha maydis)]